MSSCDTTETCKSTGYNKESGKFIYERLSVDESNWQAAPRHAAAGPAAISGTSSGSVNSNNNASTKADPPRGSNFSQLYTRPEKRKLSMSSISEKKSSTSQENPVPFHDASLYSHSFDSWKAICRRTRKNLHRSGLATSRIKTLTKKDYDLLYNRYLAHVKKNYNTMIQGIVTALTDVNPGEVYSMIKPTEEYALPRSDKDFQVIDYEHGKSRKIKIECGDRAMKF